MLDFCLNEVFGDARHDLQEPAVGYGSNAFDLSVVIGNEFEMGHKRSEAVPAGKRLRVNHNAGQLPLRRDEWIDLLRKAFEIRFPERTIRSDDKDVPITQQFEMNHGILFGPRQRLRLR